MAKHFYHIPLKKTLEFIQTHKTDLRAFTTQKQVLEYNALFGKSYYMLEIEDFIRFFKINKNISYSLKTIEYFNSTPFIEEMNKKLNFSQFETEHTIEAKRFFYAFCYLYYTKEPQAYEAFMQKTFLHYHTAFKEQSPIHVEYKDMSHALAKSRGYSIKESFGENEKDAFFNLFLDAKLTVEQKGVSIKTLRKKAYKNLFGYLLDMPYKEETREINGTIKIGKI